MEKQKQYSLANLFLGSLLIGLGFLFAVKEAGLLKQDLFLSARYLLPLFLIYLGLAITPIRTRGVYIIGSIFVTLLVVSIILLILHGCSTQNITEQDDWDAWQTHMIRSQHMRLFDESSIDQNSPAY